MAALAPAVPWIARGAGLLGGFLGARKAQSSAMQRTPEEQQALAGGQGAASTLAGTGAALTKAGGETTATGLGTMAPAASYYGTLLRGNRALQSQATAAPRGAITDVYRGAERNLERSGVRGPQHDVASAELGRQRAGQISSLVTGVQPAAAEGVARIGAQQANVGAGQTGQGIGATGAAGNIYHALLGAGTENRKYGREEGAQFGGQLGGFLFDILRSIGKGKGGGSSPFRYDEAGGA